MSARTITPTIYDDDGLIFEEAGHYAAVKHHAISYYAHCFSTSMKKAWDWRVYIDLYASCGLGKVKDTNEIIPGSPLCALEVPDPFDRYIFCDMDSEKLDALKERVDNHFPWADARTTYIEGDSNEIVSQVVRAIPTRSSLSLCVLDIYNIENLSFETIEYLVRRRRCDLILLIPTFMQIRRKESSLIDPENVKLDTFLGGPEWRDEWITERSKEIPFAVFVFESFAKKMAGLGYMKSRPDESLAVPLRGRQIIYHLALFSRHRLAKTFWSRSRGSASGQMELFD